MNSFTLTMVDATRSLSFDSVSRCIASDDSGSFGIMAGHEHMVATLRAGLLRFMNGDGIWHYAATPGGVLRFAENRLDIVTSRFFTGDDSKTLAGELADEMARSNSDIHNARASMLQIENRLMQQLGKLSK